MIHKMLTMVGVAAMAVPAMAHGGRRLEILVVDGKLAVRGYHSEGIDDGNGAVRAYYNALHDHWHFNPAPGVVAASADLPGFDLFDAGDLAGHALTLTLVGSTRWENPPEMPPAGTVPSFTALGAGQEVFVTFGADTVSTLAMGPLELAASVSALGEEDLDLGYDVADEPTAQIMVFEYVLSTDAPGVAASDTIFVLLSPDGANGVEKLHHASLYLERFLGTAVCPADRTKDGVANLDDVSLFASAFGAGEPDGDVNGDGLYNIDDVEDFVASFLLGCE